ncbi:hypothetical protein AAFC00_005340 [Neodothiora populina]|uniref:Endopolyphosphatase n=1 Tax=Neodothiora populina TaxID=2781224 RepID=A0ABR3PKY3_9PEZI
MLGASAIVSPVLYSLLCGQVAGLQIPLRSSDSQKPLHLGGAQAVIESSLRKLHGRFLQVTDFHPDRFYEAYSSTSEDSACHRGSGPAGYYGAETSECDSPFALVNATFDWIKAELKDQIDFVVWTGDSARHDNDEEHPRNTQQVVGLNEYLVERVYDCFGKPDNDDDEDPTNDLVVPVVPTFGNNDILPHNIFEKGPNRWTKQYLGIWKRFIPEEQRHQFEQGGWFSVEVIPRHLAVFSLNSLYFFNSNSAVDGCAAKSEPGYRQLEWLRIQLQYMRDRGMKAIIIGHVPPARTENKKAWDETCWQKYALWMRQYRDVVVGSMYGHMNLDHFMLQDFNDIDEDVSNGYEMIRSKARSTPDEEDAPVKAQASGNYLVDLREGWSKLPHPPSKKEARRKAMVQDNLDTSDDARPEWEIEALIGGDISESDAEADIAMRKGKKKKKPGNGKKPNRGKDYLEAIGGAYAERFSLSFAAPSVVPNYFPTIRVFEYNITGLQTQGSDAWSSFFIAEDTPTREALNEIEIEAAGDVDIDMRKKKPKKPKRQRFTVPNPPSSSAPPGPAYSPQALSLTKFTQYYANLTQINNDFNVITQEQLEEQKWREGKHKGKKPQDRDVKPHPTEFHYDVLYDTQEDKIYNLTDLSMRSVLDLAQRIGTVGKSKKKDMPDLAINEEGEEVETPAESEAEAIDASGKDKKKKKNKGKHGKKKKHTKHNKAWLAFVRRAFVATMDEDEIEEDFGG